MVCMWESGCVQLVELACFLSKNTCTQTAWSSLWDVYTPLDTVRCWTQASLLQELTQRQRQQKHRLLAEWEKHLTARTNIAAQNLEGQKSL